MGYRGSLPFLLCTPSPVSPSLFPSPAGGREMRGGGGRLQLPSELWILLWAHPSTLPGFLGQAWGKTHKQK